MTGAAYANASTLQVLLGTELLERLRGKDGLDCGCGMRVEAVEIAGVARSVFGLDILPASIETARFREVEGGLNQMTVRHVEKLVAGTPFRLAHLEVVPIRKVRPVANRLTRECTTSIVRCVLERPSLGDAVVENLDDKAGIT